MLKRRLNKNQPRAAAVTVAVGGGHRNNIHRLPSATKNENEKATVVVATPPSVPPVPVPVVLNRRVYPNGCLKKTSSVKAATATAAAAAATDPEEVRLIFPSSSNETGTTIKPTTSAAMSAAASSNGSVHTTTTSSTAPPPPPKIVRQSTSSLSSLPLPESTSTEEETDATKPLSVPTNELKIRLSSKKSVSFQEVYIREFERILGDNPSCSSGAPISLGWNYAMDKSLPLDEYEERQSKYARRTRNSRSNRGAQDELILSRHDRETLLIEWGVTFNEMIDAIRTNVKIKNQRRRTVSAIGTYDRIEEIMENTASKLKGKLKSKKNSTGNGTIVASHNHGAAEVPSTLANQKQRSLLHSNYLQSATHKNRAGIGSGRGNDLYSVRSIDSSDNSHGGSSSDKVSNSTTTSASNVAICCEENVKRNGCRIDEVSTETVSIDVLSEVNDFSSNVRTPASSVIATTDETKHIDGRDGDATNPTTTIIIANGNDNNAVNNNNETKASTTLYDLDEEIEIALAQDAAGKNEQKKYRSSSFDGQHDDTHQYKNAMKSHRPLLGNATKVVLEPIIGVDIPRDVKLQRSISVESGLTYDPHAFISENKYDCGTVPKQNDDDISTLAYDTEHETTEHQDGMSEQEETDHDLNFSGDVTVPSIFLQEFNKLMMDDCHPKLNSLSMDRSLDEDTGGVIQPASPAWTQPNNLEQQQQRHNIIVEANTKTEILRENTHINSLPIVQPTDVRNRPLPPLQSNLNLAIGDGDHDDKLCGFLTQPNRQ